MGIECPDIRTAHLALHPIGFVDGGLQRRVIVRSPDLSASRQPGAGDAELGNQFLDYLQRFMRDLVHALRHRAAMGRVDAAEGEPKLRRDDAAVTAAGAPARLIGFQDQGHEAALCDVMRGREPGVARADNGDIGLNLA